MVDPTSAEPLPADLFSRVDPAIVMAEVDRLDQAGNGSILELTPAELEVLRGIGGPALVTQVQRDFNLVAAPEDHLVMQ